MHPIEQIEEGLIKVYETCSKNSVTLVAWIISQIEFGELGNDNCSRYPLIAIVRLYIFKLIKGFRSYSRLTDYLKKNNKEAFLLGFWLDQDGNIDLPPKRTFNDYLSKFCDKKSLDKVAEKILACATQKCISLDLLGTIQKFKEKRKGFVRERREAVRIMRKMFYPLITLKLGKNAKFTSKEMLDVMAYIVEHTHYTEGGSIGYHEEKDIEESPSGESILYTLSKFDSIKEIKNVFDRVLDYSFEYIRKNYPAMRNRKFTVAYDVHKVPFWGKPHPLMRKGEFKDGTNNFFMYLTCSIVVDGWRFILDVEPYTEMDHIPDLLEKSLKKIKNKVRIERILMDRGFNSTDVISVVNNQRLQYLMPMVRSNTVKSVFDKAEGCPSYVVEDFIIGKGKDAVKTNLVLVDDKQGIKRAFITNIKISPIIAFHLYKMYSPRWGIETSYRKIEHDFCGKTTSRRYNIRLFYFLFSTCLHNLWVFVNLYLFQQIYGEVKKKPIITARLFCLLLHRVRFMFNEPG